MHQVKNIEKQYIADAKQQISGKMFIYQVKYL